MKEAVSNQLNMKKRQEILRSFFVYSGVHDVNSITEILGVSESTYYKTLEQMTNLLYYGDFGEASEYSNADAIRNRVKFDPYHQMQNFLGRLYQTNEVNDKERLRYALILKLLDVEGELTTDDIERELPLTNFLDENEESIKKHGVSKRGLRRYLNDLIEEGMITKERRLDDRGKYPSYYQLRSFFEEFTEDELYDLHAFITYITYAEIPAAPGFSLLEKLNRHMVERETYTLENLDHTIFQYPYSGRVLDEYICYELVPLMEGKFSVKMNYTSVKQQRKKVVKSKKDSSDYGLEIIPLRIIFDYHFARWYLIGQTVDAAADEPLKRYRIDYISDIKKGEKAETHKFDCLQKQCDLELQHTWCVTYTHETTKVKVLFRFDQSTDKENFIKKKVNEQGQWGEIIEEYEDGSFLWEIAVSGISEITPWLRSFGRGAVVVEPKELREKMKEDWKAVIEQYENYS